MRNILIHEARRAPPNAAMNDLTAPLQTENASRTDAAWLDAHWMPFTGNRQFKADPRMIVAAKGAY